MTQNPPKFELYNSESQKELACIRILEGKFKNTEYHYITTKFLDEDPPRLSYTYKILNETAESDELNQIVGDILVKIISEKFNIVEK